MDRVTRLLNHATRAHRVLEIGAGYNPVAPKAEGWTTHVVDHAGQAELREKYAPASVDLARIEPVDTIWRDGPLDRALPAGLLGGFDMLIASHVLEHMPDLIGFLRSAERVLRPDGAISIALPDRRFCFDCLKPPTLAGDLIEAHLAGHVRHSVRTGWSHLAYSVRRGELLAWDRSATEPLRWLGSLRQAGDVVALSRDAPDAPYVDYHCWYFTPAGFALAMLELAATGHVDWRIESLSEVEGFEFFAVLRRGRDGLEDRARIEEQRLALFHRVLREQREMIDAVLGARVAVDLGLGMGQADGMITDSPSVDLTTLADRHYAAGDLTRKADSYLREYERILAGRREQPLRVLELGVSSGASLLLWRDYLPNAVIVGVDIDPMPEKLRGWDRVHFLQGSQDDPAVLDRAASIAGGAFDLIVDDASHIGYLTKRSFLYLFQSWLRPGGTYVIEDFGTGYLPDYPDGSAFVAPADGDAVPATRVFASHQFGMAGVVKQLIDHMMQGLITGQASHLVVERLVVLTNIAFIEKSLGPAGPVPVAVTTLAPVSDLAGLEARVAEIEVVLGRLLRRLSPLRWLARFLGLARRG
jgi:SAM-dependent methyltransferase